jgi:1-acyl-sn-glycerol-3-phosphate acyltransferase
MTKPERSYSRGWRLFTVVILRPLLHALMKQEFQGRENFPQEGGIILAPNHLSYADWGTVALFSYESGRYPVFLIKSGVFNVKFVGSLLRKVGQLPVYRGRGDAALVLRDAERAIREDACVIVYPEGTASRDPNLWPMRARTGVARLALTTGAPVIPIAHWGAQHVLPYGTTRPHVFPRRKVRMIAGPPVDLSAFAGQPINSKTLREATDVIMTEVTVLLAGLRGETPPAVPFDPAASRRESISRTDAEQTPSSTDDATGGPAEARPT